MRKEWAKIRSLEQQLAAAGKAEQDMASKMQDHRMKMEAGLSKARLLEEEKFNATLDYDIKNKRGLASQMSQTAKKSQKGKPPVSSGKAIFKSRA